MSAGIRNDKIMQMHEEFLFCAVPRSKLKFVIFSKFFLLQTKKITIWHPAGSEQGAANPKHKS
jgi:hypothetical protein